MDKTNLAAWSGREKLQTSSVSESQSLQIHATVGEGEAPAFGDPLPTLWHWCAFQPVVENDLLATDGHVRKSDLLPPIHLPRRMWAGGSLTFHKPIHVGEPLQRHSRVRSVVEKEGKAGPMVLVTMDHAIYGAEGLAIQERQDIVYLEIPEHFAPPAKRPAPNAPVASVEVPETLLFRYSAITFNAHRIHYDLPYTQAVEKYPGLVVHGPLQATLLMRTATKLKGRAPLFFDFRGVHPMFLGSPCGISLQEDEEGMHLWTVQDGHQCMTAHAVWEGTQ